MLMENIRFNVYNLQRWFVRTLICSDEFEPPPWFYDVYEPEKLIPQIHTEHQIENRLRKKPSKFVSTPLFHFIGDRGMFFSMFFFFLSWVHQPKKKVKGEYKELRDPTAEIPQDLVDYFMIMMGSQFPLDGFQMDRSTEWKEHSKFIPFCCLNMFETKHYVL
jgi:hypothetical protein